MRITTITSATMLQLAMFTPFVAMADPSSPDPDPPKAPSAPTPSVPKGGENLDPRAGRPLTPEEIAERVLTGQTSVVEGRLHGIDDGVVSIALPLDAGVDVRALFKSGALSPAQVERAPKGTYLRFFPIAIGGPTPPMFTRRIGLNVRLQLVQDTSGAWLIRDISTPRVESSKKPQRGGAD